MLYLVWRRVCDGPRVVRTPCESRSAVLTAEPERDRCRAVGGQWPSVGLPTPSVGLRLGRARGSRAEQT